MVPTGAMGPIFNTILKSALLSMPLYCQLQNYLI
jgi:hypothetical protein